MRALVLLDDEGAPISQSLDDNTTTRLTFPRVPSDQVYVFSLTGQSQSIAPYEIRLEVD